MRRSSVALSVITYHNYYVKKFQSTPATSAATETTKYEMNMLLCLAIGVGLTTSAVSVTSPSPTPPPPPPPNQAKTYLLTDAVETHGARCLDGSPQRYWLQLAEHGTPNSSKWSIHHMGGGWCEDLAECTTRAFGKPGNDGDCYIGSSNESCFSTAGARTPGIDPPFQEVMDFRDCLLYTSPSPRDRG